MDENKDFYETLFLNKYAKEITEIKSLIVEAVGKGTAFVSFSIDQKDEFVYDVIYNYFKVMGYVSWNEYTERVEIILNTPEGLDFSNSNEDED